MSRIVGAGPNREYEIHEDAAGPPDEAPAPVPPQGRWRIYGLGLPEQILRKVYHQNAERVLARKLVTG